MFLTRKRTISEGIDEFVRQDADLTGFACIGDAIAGYIRVSLPA